MLSQHAQKRVALYHLLKCMFSCVPNHKMPQYPMVRYGTFLKKGQGLIFSFSCAQGSLLKLMGCPTPNTHEPVENTRKRACSLSHLHGMNSIKPGVKPYQICQHASFSQCTSVYPIPRKEALSAISIFLLWPGRQGQLCLRVARQLNTATLPN